ncbi:MAG: helix-turn-helix domain-containing protein, partial [Myxococcota bacterium]
VRDRHAAWFAEHGFATSLKANLDAASLDWLLHERLNLVAALEHTRQQATRPDNDTAQTALEQFVRLTTALRCAERRSRAFAFPAEHLETALGMARPHMDKLPPRLKGYFLILVVAACFVHTPKRALILIEEGLGYAQQTEDRFLEAALRGSRANHFIAIGAFDQARSSLNRVLPLLEHPVARANTMMNLAVLKMETGKIQASQEAALLMEKAAAVFQDNAIHTSLCNAHLNLSLVYGDLGRHAKAFEHVEQCETLAAELGHTWLQARTALNRLNFQAQWSRCRGLTPKKLAQRIDTIQNLIAQSHDPHLTMLLHQNVAQIHMEHKAYDRAITSYTRAIHANNSIKYRLLACSWIGLGLAHLLHVSPGQAREAFEQGLAVATEAHMVDIQRGAWLGLTLLHSIRLELEQAQLCFDHARSLEEDGLLHLGLASLALGRARERDPTYADHACAAYLDEAVASLHLVFKPDSDTAHRILTHQQYPRMMLRAVLAFLPFSTRMGFWTRVLGSKGFCIAIERQGRGFRRPGKPWVDLQNRPVLVRLLRVLMEHRSNGVSTQELIDIFYPDEVLRHEAGVNRIHKQISLLRRAGLKPLILRHKGLYTLDPNAHILLIPPETF